MLYQYILEHFGKDEPIFLNELPGKSRNAVSQEMKTLVREGKIERLSNGVYYQSYTTILGTKGRMSVDKYVDKKFINAGGMVSGYFTGIKLANLYGFTTQIPSYIEVCSNAASTKQRKVNIDGRIIVVYKPVTMIREDNVTALQFLDFMSTVDRYSELQGDELKEKLREFITVINLDYNIVRKYISLFPYRVYKNLYQTGLLKKLI